MFIRLGFIEKELKYNLESVRKNLKIGLKHTLDHQFSKMIHNKSTKLDPKTWSEDVAQANTLCGDIVHGLGESYRQTQRGRSSNSAFDKATESITELLGLLTQLRSDLEAFRESSWKYSLQPKDLRHKQQQLNELETKVQSIRVAIKEGVGRNKPVEGRLKTLVAKTPHPIEDQRKSILAVQERAKESIDRHAEEMERMVLSVREQALGISDEVVAQNRLIDEVGDAVTAGRNKINQHTMRAQMLTEQNSSFCKLYCIILFLSAILLTLLVHKFV